MVEPAAIVEFPSLAITYPKGQAYVVHWIKAILNGSKVEPFNKQRLNGQVNQPAVFEAIESLNQVYTQGGQEAAKKAWVEIIQDTVPDIAIQVNKPKRLYHASELDKMPPLRWLIEGELPERGFSVLFGQPEVGKSFQAIEYAERITMRPNRCVVYVAAEGESGYSQRHKAWMYHHKKPDHGALHFWFDAIPMLLSSAVDEFVQEIQHLKPQLIIIDTLARCMEGGDENSARDMGIFIASCRRLQRELECAVLVVHHTGKTGSGERGSSALRGAADTMIEMSNEEGYIRIACSKIKDGKPFPSRMVKRVDVVVGNGESSCVLVSADKVQEDLMDLSENQRRIVQFLADGVYDEGARTTDVKGALDMGNSSFYKSIRTLKKRRIVEKTGKYDPWILTQFGWQVAKKHGLVK